MLATLALGAVLFQQEDIEYHRISLNPESYVQIRINRLEPPKLSPKKFGDAQWEFDWLTQGYTMFSPGDTQFMARFRVYSQQRKSEGDLAPRVARMALRMWDRLYHRLRIDHPLDINSGIVDFFLCYGGDPGGEQLIGNEFIPAINDFRKVNTIYIYQLSTFKDPVEMAREVAHEYGHAVLPAIGGFKQPETWANGYLGERLFLEWLREDLAAKRLTLDDVMGASQAGLDAWVKRNIDLPAIQAAGIEPDGTQINEAQSGMDRFLALALYVEKLCPPAVFRRSLEMTVKTADDPTALRPPTDYPENVVAAAAEKENLTYAVPEALRGKTMWIPLGKGTIAGATVLKRAKNGWAQVADLLPNIIVRNRPLN